MGKVTPDLHKLLLALNSECLDHFSIGNVKNSYPVEYFSLYLTCQHFILCLFIFNTVLLNLNLIIIIIIYPLTEGVIWAQRMISQTVSSIFLCSPLPSGTCQTQGLSIPRCCLPTSFSVCLVICALSLCLVRWFLPDVMNGKHVHTAAVCVS